ncbi:MAG: cation diffusion facilitator family transporter [bacterium]|nr:cation diffusion facilitator family transporter [bacterium]
MNPTEKHNQNQIMRGIHSTAVGIAVNMFLALCKGVAGFLGNSYALIADAIESASDVISSLIVLAGLKIASVPRDENHPYGHGKAESIAAVVVSMVIFSAAIIIAIQSVKEIVTPYHPPPEPFTLLVLVVVVVIKEILFRFVFCVGEEIESTAVKTDAWHHRSDAITSAAAFVGISIALIGGKGWEPADDWAALFASAIIAFNAYKLFIPAIEDVMDTAPSPHIKEDLCKTALSVEGVLEIDKCFVRKMGLSYFVDLHVVVDEELTVRKSHDIAHIVKNTICSSNPKIIDVLIHIEPGVVV